VLWATRDLIHRSRIEPLCYDIFYRHRPDVPFFTGLAERSGGPLLELGCGTGRVLLPVVRQTGVVATGIDLDEAYLGLCRDKVAASGRLRSSVSLVHGDVRLLALGASFRLVTFPFRSFQELLTVDDQLQCLSRVREHLDDDGLLVIDNYNPSIPLLANDPVGVESARSGIQLLPDGREVQRTDRVVSRDLVAQQQVCETILYVGRSGEPTDRIVRTIRTRYSFRHELEHLLARCGFRIEVVYGDYQRGPFGRSYPGELIVLARKQLAPAR
jgi:SAM-dependent methyltransferase